LEALRRIAKAGWLISVLIFFTSLFASYFYWPEIVEIYLINSSGDFYGLERSYLFYIILFFFISFNLILLYIVPLLKKIPSEFLTWKNKEYWAKQGNYFNGILINSSITFFIAINLLYSLSVLILTLHNMEDPEFRKDISTFEWIKFLWLAVVIIWPLFLLLRINYKKKIVE
jgi:hypothetical protein